MGYRRIYLGYLPNQPSLLATSLGIIGQVSAKYLFPFILRSIYIYIHGNCSSQSSIIGG